MPGPVTDPRAHALRERYRAFFPGNELPVPVESIAQDLLGIWVEERSDLECSGLLVPAERRVVVRADEPKPRKRFTLAHELGHWVCQVQEGHAAPIYCRDVDVSEAADRQLEREANVFAAELLMPESAVRAVRAELADIAACAATFDVSPTAMQWRLYSFGLAEVPA
jgi:hypothetical protein